MRNALIISLAFFVACGPAGLPRPLEDRSPWGLEFEDASTEGSIIKAAWVLKEKLKKDCREIIGPLDAYEEIMDLKFRLAVNEAMLESSAYYERVTKRWAESKTDPPPTRETLAKAVKLIKGRVAKLEEFVARELEAAEKQTKPNEGKRERIIEIVAGIVLLTLAVDAGMTTARSDAPTYKYHHGAYTIHRHGPSIVITSRSGRTYYCQAVGPGPVSDAVCN